MPRGRGSALSALGRGEGGWEGEGEGEGAGATPVLLPSQSFAVAPMREYTTRHFNVLARQLSSRAVLYTEMHKPRAVAEAREQGRAHALLGRAGAAGEGAEVLQLGGDCPRALARAARAAVEFGYEGVDLNAGCPSVVAGGGAFGASLMRDAELTASCLEAIAEAVDAASRERGDSLPPVVSLKCRVAVAETEDEAAVQRVMGEGALKEGLREFLERSAVRAGCRHVAVHARQAVMRGLSPAANREVPPLMHGVVAALAADLSGAVRLTANGGIDSAERARELLSAAPQLAGVMAGRWLIRRPLDLAEVDSVFYGEARKGDSLAIAVRALSAYGEHVNDELAAGVAPPAELALPLALVAAQLEEDGDGSSPATAARTQALWSALEEAAAPLLREDFGDGRRRLVKELQGVGGKKVGAKHRRTRAEATRAAAQTAPRAEHGRADAAVVAARPAQAASSGTRRRWQDLEL